MPVNLISSGGGTTTLTPAASASNFTQTLPAATTTLVGTDATQTLTNKTIGSGYGGGTIISGTAVATTSGTAFDYTGIPSWVKRITVMFNGVSLSGNETVVIQLGDAGGIETTGYSGSANDQVTNATNSTFFNITATTNAAFVYTGSAVITSFGNNTWVENGAVASSASGYTPVSCGAKTLSDTLTQIRITRSGTSTFDAGSINILYE